MRRMRRFLAAAVVAALPLLVGALHAAPAPPAADAASEQHVIESPGGPQWLYWAGVDWDTAHMLAEKYAGCWGCMLAYTIAR